MLTQLEYFEINLKHAATNYLGSMGSVLHGREAVFEYSPGGHKASKRFGTLRAKLRLFSRKGGDAERVSIGCITDCASLQK